MGVCVLAVQRCIAFSESLFHNDDGCVSKRIDQYDLHDIGVDIDEL